MCGLLWENFFADQKRAFIFLHCSRGQGQDGEQVINSKHLNHTAGKVLFLQLKDIISLPCVDIQYIINIDSTQYL